MTEQARARANKIDTDLKRIDRTMDALARLEKYELFDQISYNGVGPFVGDGILDKDFMKMVLLMIKTKIEQRRQELTEEFENL